MLRRSSPTRACVPHDRLRDALQRALDEAVVGQPIDRRLAGRACAAARAVLPRHGHGRSQASAQVISGGVLLTVTLPPRGAQVQELRLQATPF